MPHITATLIVEKEDSLKLDLNKQDAILILKLTREGVSY